MRRMLPRSWPGLLIATGVAVRIVYYLIGAVAGSAPRAWTIVDVVAAVAIAVGAGTFLVRGVAALKRRLLWRVRRKLIISYIFIGFVPVMLVAAFFLLGGVLLFFNFSRFLVRNEFLALRERARAVAHDVAVEIERHDGRDIESILGRRQQALAAEMPTISLAVVRVQRTCPSSTNGGSEAAHAPVALAGPWAHVVPPATLPDWIGCEGVGSLYLYGDPTAIKSAVRPLSPYEDVSLPVGVVIRGAAMAESSSPAYAVVVDIVVDQKLTARIRDSLGVAPEAVREFDPKVGMLPARAGSGVGGALFTGNLPLPSIAYSPYHDWQTGQSGLLTVAIRLSIPEIYRKITATPGERDVGTIVLILLQVVGGLFLVIEAFALLVGLTLAKSITGSVHELFTGTERVRRGDFSHKIASTADDQLGELAQSFNSMTASIEELLEQAAQKKRLEEELRIAHEIQMSLLPQGQLRMPGISVTAHCVPAREVGGDYYDFLPMDDGRLGILIADVSGKGTSAALYMAELKGLVLSLSRIHTSPRALLVEANRIIARHLDARSFITITYAVIDLQARTMTYARAGHTPLMVLPASVGDRHGRARILAPGGMVLGLKIDQGEMFEKLLEEDTVALRTGDLYLFFTDGITEAMNAHDDYFGEARLGGLLEEHADLPPDELRERLLREVETFVGSEPQHDDMTMILLRVEDLEQMPARSFDVHEALAASA